MLYLSITTFTMCLVATTTLAVPIALPREEAIEERSWRSFEHRVEHDAPKVFHAVEPVVEAVAPVLAKAAVKALVREEASSGEHYTRDYPDHEHQHVAAVPHIRENELETRSNLWQKIKNVFHKAVDFVAPIAKVATKFIREDGEEYATRDLADYELGLHHSRDLVQDNLEVVRAEDGFEVESRWSNEGVIAMQRDEAQEVEEFARDNLDELD